VIFIGIAFVLAIALFLGYWVVQAAISQRYWRRVIARGDVPTLQAALLEALDAWRRVRPSREMPPADWRALQSAEVVAADTERCRVTLLVEPDIRVIDGQRRQIGPPLQVAERASVRMAERLLYEVPLARFEAVQIDAYTEYRSPDGDASSECLLTVQVSREAAMDADWDTLSEREILDGWGVRRRIDGQPLDPGDGALITPAEAPMQAPSSPPESLL
jgi:hypothetical protein